MGAPVWVLSVDLQTKTATFQSGMADAARAARGSFGEISSGANKMGEEVGRTSGEARHGVMMLGEEFGVHLPRGLTTFIASIGPVGAAMEAAFPFIAIILGATLLLEHLAKVREAGMKLTEDQEKFETAAQRAFNSLDEKLLQAEKRTDELRNDHLGALQAELKLIDMQSLDELAAQFEKVAKAADTAFAQVQAHWYSFGIGSAGAKHALESFQTQYDLLLAKGKSDEAAGLLSGTLAQAEKINNAMKQFKDNQADPTTGKKGNYAAAEAAAEVLRQVGLVSKITGEFTADEATAQQTLVDALQAQLHIQQQVATLNAADKGAAKAEYNKKSGDDAKKYAEEMARAEQEGVNRMGEIIRAANAQMAADTDAGWKQRIAATSTGSAERLAVIDAAIADEEAMGMEQTSAYRSLLAERVATHRQMVDEDAKLTAEAAREAASQQEKMSQLALASEREQWALYNSGRRVSNAERLAQEIQMAQEETALQMTAISQQIAGLDKGGRDYENKLRELQDRQEQMVQAHEDQITAIKDKAEMKQNQSAQSALARLEEMTSRGLTEVLMGHESFAKAMDSVGNQVVSGMMQNALKSMMTLDMDQERQAASAARKAFNIGLGIGGPAGMVLGPVFAATTFAAMMAFHDGGVVPGVGRGDIVPAMLEPGEGVLSKQLMDRLSTSGPGQSGPTYHLSLNPTYHVSALDSDGMADVLDKHTDVLQSHFENTLRRMNR